MADREPSNPEDLLARYIDRLNDGERLRREEILAENPVHGPEIVEHLEGFIEWTVEGDANEPLGTLGDYTLRRQIGRGGMGVVYEAWEGSMDRRVALKVLPAAVAADNKAFLRFMREAKTAGQLSHPNVVPVFAMGVKEQTPYYAMEYIEGETLAQVLARLKEAGPDAETPFGKKDSVVYFGKLADAFAEVADGLQHAHSKKVIHRDIKPSNLILDGEGRLRILDFGLARLEGQESLTISGDLVGTPQYMSPEQARRKKIEVDHRTDVYSLGATLYEALTLRPPFRGKDHQDTLSQIIERDPVEPRRLNPRVPKDLETIVLKCLRKDAGDRYGTAEALSQDLRRFVRGEVIEARPPTGVERAGQFLQRHARKIGMGLFAVAWIGGAIGFTIDRLAERRQDRLTAYERAIEEAYLSLQLQSLSIGQDDPQNWCFIGYLGLTDFRGRVQALERNLAALLQASESLPQRPEAYHVRSEALLLLGDREGALSELRRGLRSAPGFPPSTLLLQELSAAPNAEPSADSIPAWAVLWRDAFRAWRQGDHAAAVRGYMELLDWIAKSGEPFFGAALEARVAGGQARLALGDVRALGDFEVLRSRYPEAIEPTLLLGKALHVLGFPNVADELLRSLHEKTPQKNDVGLWLVYCYRRLGDLTRAEFWNERLEDEALRQRIRAMLRAAQGNPQEAIAAAETAVRIDPGDPRNHECLIRTLDHTGRQATILEEALRLFPRDPGLLSWIPQVRFRQGRHLEGVQAARDFLREVGPNWQVQEHLAHNLLRVGKPEEALQELDGIVRKHPLYDRCEIGWATFCLGRLLQAREATQRCLALYPQDEQCLRFLGMIHERLGEAERAGEYFREACEKAPWSDLAHFTAGLFFERRGEDERALEEYVHTLARRPNYDFLHLHLAAVLEQAGQLQISEEALRKQAIAIDRVVEENPGDERILHLRVLVELRLRESRLDRFDSILDPVELAERSPLPYFVHSIRGEALWKVGRKSAALPALQQALTLPHATRWTVQLLERYRQEAGDAAPVESPRNPEFLVQLLEPGQSIRINCGGGDSIDHQGRTWRSDSFFLNGWPHGFFEQQHLSPGDRETASRGWEELDDHYKFQGGIEGTQEDYLLQTNRWWHPEENRAGYSVPVIDGDYRVTLSFAEVWFAAPKLRLLNIHLEGQVVETGVDVFDRVGFAAPLSLTHSARVTDGALDIMVRATGGSPYLSAIEIERQ